MRTNFAIKDLPGYVRRYRGAIIAGLLTLVTAWTAAGSVTAEKTSSDCYAHWVSVVRAILENAGVPGTFDHADSAQQRTGVDDEGWGEFITAIYKYRGENTWKVRDLIDQMSKWDDAAKELADALPGDLHERHIKARNPDEVKKSLGKWLRNRTGRWASEHVVELAGRETATNASLWKVRRFTPR